MNLLDVNVLIAILDPAHEHHTLAQQTFLECRAEGWATCTLTENAVIRILSHPSYPNHTAKADLIREMLCILCQQPGHQFWENGPTLRDQTLFPTLQNSKKLTDQYLLGLAVFHGGTLVTLDQGIDPSSVSAGKESLRILTP